MMAGAEVDGGDGGRAVHTLCSLGGLRGGANLPAS